MVLGLKGLRPGSGLRGRGFAAQQLSALGLPVGIEHDFGLVAEFISTKKCTLSVLYGSILSQKSKVYSFSY